MCPDGPERRLAAILSADVVGYSRLIAEDEAGTIRTLTSYRKEIQGLVGDHRGRIVDFTGDNFLVEFPTALDAVECAVEIQRVLAARNASLPEDRRMEFRVGVHMGDVTAESSHLYGDGINIAARLEGLAEPGGVCISDMVYNQVEKKLTVQLEDLGEHTLKNISRPVRIYGTKLLLAGRERGGVPRGLPGMEERTVPGFHGAPAIAVLPFDNLSRDPEQEYFADGIAEDLITRLSALRTHPIIARNSSFVYKEKATDVKEIAGELGARYIVEGSVRKADDRVRISAQLIDGTSGAHVWAGQYDREIRDIFSVQDEITEAISASISAGLIRSEGERVEQREAQSLDAWDCVARASWFMSGFSEDGNATARELYERAIELDPQFAVAFAGLAHAHYLGILYQWVDPSAGAVAKLIQAAQRAATLDGNSALSQMAMSFAYRVTGQKTKMIGALELAIELNPSYTLAYHLLGSTLAMGGRWDEGIEKLGKAMRLSPHDPLMWMFLHGMAMAHFAAERYGEAVDWAQRCLQRRPDYVFAWATLAASYVRLGRTNDAEKAVDEILRLRPEFRLEGLKPIFSIADPDYRAHFFDGLRNAGLPEE